ncbi:MAG: Rne/Rng family ribonuclease, partial [Aestuariivirgaceae bacterium]
MASKMLIDAAHSEETRVVVVRGNRIEEFDYESAQRKQLKGNIYLAKVTRVEPSLQAAFVDYGGNRHGFLAFSEIHPDYYQIPVADRQALLEEEEEDVRRSQEEDDASEAAAASGTDGQASQDQETADGDVDAASAANDDETGADNDNDNGADEDQRAEKVDSVGAEDALEEVPQRQRRQRRNYKIQEVIKRRQVILVQVVKEERGNKGAALTTYLSLAGRYCVLMPNTARGGGISRKITDASDRRRLKEVARDTKVQPGMGLIVRTAGAQRTKAEIKRDFDYLMRLWGNVRDLTLESTAPALVYEEGSLIKRSIRDLYTKDVEEVLVEGEAAVKEAKGFMKMLMPSHARHVKAYKDTQPLFSRFKVESQLDGLFSPTVTLQSGGYMVINQTEALVAIDINSGKATREHNIEDTALKTNMEAAQEIARQLRLRDLAGLIVIDFIDMEEKRNNRSVERKMKESLKNDRARIQVGRISHFGLLEMSRQRLRQGMLENSSLTCPECG